MRKKAGFGHVEQKHKTCRLKLSENSAACGENSVQTHTRNPALRLPTSVTRAADTML